MTIAMLHPPHRPCLRRFSPRSLSCGRPPARRRPAPVVERRRCRSRLSSISSKVTTEGTPDFVPPAERIAVFDNDGTLWAEQPMYFQLAVRARPREGARAAAPRVEDKEPFASVLAGDLKAALAGGERRLLELIMATHAGMTTEEFEPIVSDWLATAQAPEHRQALHRDGLPADARAARLPARERVQDVHRLRRRRRVHAALGGEGVRHPARAGHRLAASRPKYEMRDGKPVLVRLPEVDFIDDKAGKPVGIQQHIGRRPDPRLRQLGRRLPDARVDDRRPRPAPRPDPPPHRRRARVRAYDRESHFGRLDKALDVATQRGWT